MMNVMELPSVLKQNSGMISRIGMAIVMACAVSLANTSDSYAATSAEKLVAKKASIVSKMHKKAKKALVNSAQDNVFGEYFHSTSDPAKAQSKTRIQGLTLRVQGKFHVDEMCLIAIDGVELTRIVGNEIAPDSDLSLDETGAIFFAPGFALKKKESLVSPTYMSPDAMAWVIAYVTPIVVDGKITSILHYEHGMKVFQEAIIKGVSGDQYMLAVTDEGFIVSDSRSPVNFKAKSDKEEQVDYFAAFDSSLKAVVSGDKGAGSIPGFDVAFQKVEGGLTLIAVTKQ